MDKAKGKNLKEIIVVLRKLDLRGFGRVSVESTSSTYPAGKNDR